MSVTRDPSSSAGSSIGLREHRPVSTTPMEFPAEFLLVRRTLGDAAASPALAGSLREAGFRIGETLYTRFGDWLALRGDLAPEQLSDDVFATLMGEFFLVSGWGQVHIAPLSAGVMALDAIEWCEARAGGKDCLVSTGLFSGFFGRFADGPISVMEVECNGSGHPHCRFLLAADDVLRRVHAAMLRGATYASAASRE